MAGGDLPDWSTGRRVTGDPLLTINQAIPGGGYSSPILDVGEYSQLIITGSAQTSTALYRVQVMFLADALGAYQVEYEYVYLYGQAIIYTHAYPVSGRYVQLNILELTATGNRVVVLAIPSSGPPLAIPDFPLQYSSSEQLVNAGATLTYTPFAIFRDKINVHISTLSPRWSATVWAARLNTIWDVVYTVSSETHRSPVDLALPAQPAQYRVTFTNQWAYNAYASVILQQGQE